MHIVSEFNLNSLPLTWCCQCWYHFGLFKFYIPFVLCFVTVECGLITLLSSELRDTETDIDIEVSTRAMTGCEFELELFVTIRSKCL